MVSAIMMALQMNAIKTVTIREALDARRSRWFWVFTLIFVILAVTVSFLGMAGLGEIGVAGFARTTASLLNLVVFIVPMMGLLLGSLSMSLEREHGSLPLLLAQPVDPGEIVLGKWLGLTLSTSAAILIAFGFSGAVVTRFAGWHDITMYLFMVLVSILLAMVHLGIGMALGTFLQNSAMAIGSAIFLWLAEVMLSDVTLIMVTLGLKLHPVRLFWILIANPVQAYRILVLNRLHGDLEYFGPVGRYAIHQFGHHLDILLIGILMGWLVVSLVVAVVHLRRSGAK